MKTSTFTRHEAGLCPHTLGTVTMWDLMADMTTAQGGFGTKLQYQKAIFSKEAHFLTTNGQGSEGCFYLLLYFRWSE